MTEEEVSRGRNVRQINDKKKRSLPDNIPADAPKSDWSNCKVAPYYFQTDIRGRTSADRLRREILYQNTKEMKLERVWGLQRHHNIIGTRKRFQQCFWTEQKTQWTLKFETHRPDFVRICRVQNKSQH